MDHNWLVCRLYLTVRAVQLPLSLSSVKKGNHDREVAWISDFIFFRFILSFSLIRIFNSFRTVIKCDQMRSFVFDIERRKTRIVAMTQTVE